VVAHSTFTAVSILTRDQWFLTWVNLPLGVNFIFEGGKFTEP